MRGLWGLQNGCLTCDKGTLSRELPPSTAGKKRFPRLLS